MSHTTAVFVAIRSVLPFDVRDRSLDWFWSFG